MMPTGNSIWQDARGNISIDSLRTLMMAAILILFFLLIGILIINKIRQLG